MLYITTFFLVLSHIADINLFVGQILFCQYILVFMRNQIRSMVVSLIECMHNLYYLEVQS